MPNLKEVKNRISSVGSIQQITRAMKMVAAAKLRKAQQRAWRLRPYVASLADIVSGLLQTPGAETPLLSAPPKPEAPTLLIPIAADKGLCGGFNSIIMKATLAQIQAHAPKVHLLPLGRRAYGFSQKTKKTLTTDYYQIFQALQYAKAQKIGQHIVQQYLQGHASRVILIYNEEKNVATQVLRTRTILPIALAPPTRAKTAPTEYIYEPSQAKILDTLLPLLLYTQLYQALVESNAAEHGARMTAMGKASENADQLLKELRLSYNRTRQAVITREILEIVGGAEALKEA